MQAGNEAQQQARRRRPDTCQRSHTDTDADTDAPYPHPHPHPRPHSYPAPLCTHSPTLCEYLVGAVGVNCAFQRPSSDPRTTLVVHSLACRHPLTSPCIRFLDSQFKLPPTLDNRPQHHGRALTPLATCDLQPASCNPPTLAEHPRNTLSLSPPKARTAQRAPHTLLCCFALPRPTPWHNSTARCPGTLPARTWLTVRQNHVVLEGLLAHNDLVRPTRLARLPVPDWPSHPHPPEPPRRPYVHHGQRRRVPHRPALALPARRARDQQRLHRLPSGPHVPQLALLARYARLAQPADDAGIGCV